MSLLVLSWCNFRFQPKVCDGYHDLKGPEMSRVGSNFTCYVVMRIYLRVLKKHENYCPQVLLKNVNISSKKDWWQGILLES